MILKKLFLIRAVLFELYYQAPVRRMILAMSSNTAYLGTNRTNPFHYQKFQLNENCCLPKRSTLCRNSCDYLYVFLNISKVFAGYGVVGKWKQMSASTSISHDFFQKIFCQCVSDAKQVLFLWIIKGKLMNKSVWNIL